MSRSNRRPSSSGFSVLRCTRSACFIVDYRLRAGAEVRSYRRDGPRPDGGRLGTTLRPATLGVAAFGTLHTQRLQQRLVRLPLVEQPKHHLKRSARSLRFVDSSTASARCSQFLRPGVRASDFGRNESGTAGRLELTSLLRCLV